MTWLDNVFEQHRSSNMRVRSLRMGERDLWCVKGAKDGYHIIQSLTAYLFFINCKIILWQKEPKVILSRSVTDQKWNLRSITPMYCSPFSSQQFSFYSKHKRATRKRRCQQSHCWTSPTYEPHYWLGLCAMPNLQHQLLLTTDPGKLVY